MKRIFAMLLVLVLVLCAGAQAAEVSDWYLETAKEMALCVGELARDKAYQKTKSDEDFEIIAPLREADFADVRSAWRFETYPADFWMMLMGASMKEGKLSAAGQRVCEAEIPQMLVIQHNSALGATALAATTILTYERSYIMPEDFSPCVIALELNGAAVAVAFAQTGEDTITATACPLFHGEDETDAETVAGLGAILARTKEQIQ